MSALVINYNTLNAVEAEFVVNGTDKHVPAIPACNLSPFVLTTYVSAVD